MDCGTMMRRGGLALALLCGCPASAEPGDTDGDTEAVEGTGPTACTPGTSLDCACSDGSMGTQTCAPDGGSYGECQCGSDDASSTGTSLPTTGDPSGDPSTTAETGSGESTSSSETSAAEESTSASECAAGETMECDCGSGPGVATCTDGGQFGACECCEGSHPLVEGDLRYCDEGHCYCGDLEMKPPLDACYAETIADPCCPVDLECY